ncbi:MAG: hypothetical protein Q9186_003729 [Xanthomendoza sp. 1 TL-2023]
MSDDLKISLKLYRKLQLQKERLSSGPFEKKVIAETLASMERYKTATLLALQTGGLGIDQALSKRHRGASFRSWISANLVTLCCEGIPGAGKTVIASTVVDHLRLQSGLNPSVTRPASFLSGLLDSSVTSTFSMHKERAIQTGENLFGSIIKQLAEGHLQKFFPFVKNLYKARNRTHERPLSTDLVSMLGSMLRTFQHNYIVVDALDECTDEVKDSLLNGFDSLQKVCNLKIMLTSRPNTITGLSDYPNAGFLEIRARNEDIGRYISSRVPSEPRSFASFRKKPELVALVIGTMTLRCQGMFLLARLHLDSVARTMSAAALKANLQRLPRQLNTTYDGAIRRIEQQDDEHADLARRVLAWILYASRSMTILELQHALAIESTQSTQGIDEHIFNASDIIYSCAGLVTLDKKTDTIRMVHFSAQEYFSATRQTHFPNGQLTIAAACLKYLNSDLFSRGRFRDENEVENRRKECPFFDYAARFWGHHARESGSDEALFSTILDFMNSKSNLSCATQAAMRQFLYHSWTQYPTDSPVLPPLLIAANFGLVDITISLLEQGADVDEYAPTSNGIGALGIASQNGHLEIVKILLDRGANLHKAQSHGISPLYRAASMNHPKVVHCIVKHDSETIHLRNIWESSASNPYAAGASSQHTMLQYLFEQGAVVNVRGCHGNNVLHGTVCGGADPAIIRLIIGIAKEQGKMHSLLNGRNMYLKSPLHDAVERNRLAAVSVLLEYDPETGADLEGRTPLHWAVSKNYPALAKLLLEKNRDPGFVNKRVGPKFKDMTALEMAVEKQYMEIIKIISEVL